MSALRPFRYRPRATPLPESVSIEALLVAWRGERGLAALDSAGGQPHRWSLVALAPRADLPPPRDLAAVRALTASFALDGPAPPGPFRGGFLGALAYDAGVAGERLDLPADPWDTPHVVGGIYTDFAVIDHGRGGAWLVLDEREDDGREPVDRRRERLLARLANASSDDAQAFGVGPLRRCVPSAEHVARIERVQELIAAGELYQANLAHRFERATRGHPVDLYRRLRRTSPGPYLGYLEWGAAGADRPAGALLCASPELLLETCGRGVRTRPIKGTAGRDADPERDARNRDALLTSVKERAELAMIVDLERNDLARIAVPGSVRVERLAELQTFATVHHLVADVRARLRRGHDGGDALASLFPGGSITGAPKLRAMEVIAELEREGRGFFTGSLGFLDTRGDACFNILIRTLVWRPLPDAPGRGADGADGEVCFHVGGGITAASIPADEERETLYKGAALAAASSGPDQDLDTFGLGLPPLGGGRAESG